MGAGVAGCDMGWGNPRFIRLTGVALCPPSWRLKGEWEGGGGDCIGGGAWGLGDGWGCGCGVAWGCGTMTDCCC